MVTNLGMSSVRDSVIDRYYGRLDDRRVSRTVHRISRNGDVSGWVGCSIGKQGWYAALPKTTDHQNNARIPINARFLFGLQRRPSTKWIQ